MSPLSAAALLAACATAAPPEQAAAPSAPASAAAPAQTTSRAARLLAAAGRPDAPTRSEIERVFGPADIVRQEGAGAALTYRLDNCALLLLFAADGRSVMRLAQVSPGARHAGAAAPSLDQCAAEASARRS